MFFVFYFLPFKSYCIVRKWCQKFYVVFRYVHGENKTFDKNQYKKTIKTTPYNTNTHTHMEPFKTKRFRLYYYIRLSFISPIFSTASVWAIGHPHHKQANKNILHITHQQYSPIFTDIDTDIDPRVIHSNTQRKRIFKRTDTFYTSLDNFHFVALLLLAVFLECLCYFCVVGSCRLLTVLFIADLFRIYFNLVCGLFTGTLYSIRYILAICCFWFFFCRIFKSIFTLNWRKFSGLFIHCCHLMTSFFYSNALILSVSRVFFFLFFSIFQHKLRSKLICVVFFAFYFCCIKTSTNAFRLLEIIFGSQLFVCLFVCQRKEVFFSQLMKTSSKCGQWKVSNPKSVFVSNHLNSSAFAWNISNIRNIEVDKWIRF